MVSSTVHGAPWLVVVTGWTGAGKSTLADALASELGATVASFDWVMSALRSHEDVWSVVEDPVERQRRIGWDLLARVAEQQLRSGRSCILDLVAREQPRQAWAALAGRYGASFGVVECVCADVDVLYQIKAPLTPAPPAGLPAAPGLRPSYGGRRPPAGNVWRARQE